MSLWRQIKSLLAPQSFQTTSLHRLDASSEAALSASLKKLRSGQRGWITLLEARTAFSSMDDQYAFGEMDDQGKSALASFAAEHKSDFQFMPVEGRLYFIRKEI